MKPFSQQDAKAWHAEHADAVLTSWSTSESGLSQAEVERRQHEYGPNVLPERGTTPVWKIVLRQFVSPLIYILVAAAVVSALITDTSPTSLKGTNRTKSTGNLRLSWIR
jgi:P-type Ca2+ transporter type 2C